MKRTIIILTVLLLSLAGARTAFAVWTTACSEPNAKTFLYYVAQNSVITFNPIVVTRSGGKITLTTSVNYRADNLPDGTEFPPPQKTTDGQPWGARCKIYNEAEPLKEVTDAAYCGDAPPSPYAKCSKAFNEYYENRIMIDNSGQWTIDMQPLPVGRYLLDCAVYGTKEVLEGETCKTYSWPWPNASPQTFEITAALFEIPEPPFSGGDPSISGVKVDESGNSYILKISGNNFSNKSGSVSLKAGKRALLSKNITIISWKNKEVLCQVTKNPKAKTNKTRAYRLFLNNGVSEVKYIFRYPPRS